jgi:hypothetical protein
MGLGNLVELTMNTSADRISAMDYQNSGLKESIVHYQGEKREVTFTVDSVQRQVLELMLGSLPTTLAGASVTAEAGTIVAGQEYYPLGHNNVTVWTSLTHTSGTPIYVDGTDYDVELATGRIRIISTGALAAGVAVKANYTYGANTTFNVGSLGAGRFSLMFDGYSDYDPTRVKRITIPNFVLSPENNLPLIADDFMKVQLKGSALYDVVTGRFATWEQKT